MTTNVKDLVQLTGCTAGKKDYSGFVSLMETMGIEVRLNGLRQGWDMRVKDSSWFDASERNLDTVWGIAASGWTLYVEKTVKGDSAAEDTVVKAHAKAEFKGPEWRQYCKAWVAGQPMYNPLTEWIYSREEWDGTERAQHVFGNLWQIAEGSSQVVAQTVSAAVFVNLVRRGAYPGCEAQNMPILVSKEQGVGKSTFVKSLSPVPEWYTSEVEPGMNKQDFVSQMLGKWVIEVEEMAGVKARDLERLKGQISRATDRIRLPYDRLATDFPRQSSLIGTANINSKGILPLDESGYRRWWAIELLAPRMSMEASTAYMNNNRDQLFAEALAIVRDDGARLNSILEPSTEIREAFTDIARSQTPEDHRFDEIAAWLTEHPPAGDKHSMISLMTTYLIHRQQELDNLVNGAKGAPLNAAQASNPVEPQRIPLKDPDAMIAGYNANRFSDALDRCGWGKTKTDGHTYWGVRNSK